MDFARRFLACITQHGSDRLNALPLIEIFSAPTVKYAQLAALYRQPMSHFRPPSCRRRITLRAHSWREHQKSSRQRGETQYGGSQR